MNKESKVILVDENDKEIGTCEKLKAHKEGKLHRAFSIFIFNSKGELLLQQRAKEKYHSGGLWTNTVCSHPEPNKDILKSIKSRLKEEMGFSTKVKELFSFIYKSDYKNGLIEYEFDHVFFGLYEKNPKPNPEEVMDFKWIKIEDIKNDINNNPNKYTSWFKVILENSNFILQIQNHFKLQPLNKSFENYIKLGYEYNLIKKITPKQGKLLKEISKIDDSILILDDIIDESKLRNAKPCLYIQEGLQKAIISSEILKSDSINSLIELMKISKTNQKNQLKILKKINEFFKNIYLGEQIDLELGKINDFKDNQIIKYFKMVSLFTGGHIKFGLEIGQLLANRDIDLDLSKIAISLGIIRQICDDFNDYFDKHHEPFGDFLTKSNRLPELLFKRNKGDRNNVLKYLENDDYTKAREVILNSDIRKELYNFCNKELEKINKIKTNFDYKVIIEDFEKVLFYE